MVDTGKGIAHDEMDRLFNMFGKLKRTAEQNSEGIGLGLMICKQLVEINGGTIKVDSKGIDKGSVFQFTMNMKPPMEMEAIDDSLKDSSVESRGSSLFNDNQKKFEAIQDNRVESQFAQSERKLL